jgi:hypothetical protein
MREKKLSEKYAAADFHESVKDLYSFNGQREMKKKIFGKGEIEFAVPSVMNAQSRSNLSPSKKISTLTLISNGSSKKHFSFREQKRGQKYQVNKLLLIRSAVHSMNFSID